MCLTETNGNLNLYIFLNSLYMSNIVGYNMNGHNYSKLVINILIHHIIFSYGGLRRKRQTVN